MARRKKLFGKYFIVWLLFFGLALSIPFSRYLAGAGYANADAFFADVLRYVLWSGVAVVPISVWALYARLSGKPPRRFRNFGVGRVTKCHQCHKTLVETTGSKCQFCGWIRCACGACGCGIGKLV